MANKTIWSDEVDAILRENYALHPNKDLVPITGLTVKQLQRRAHMLRLVKVKQPSPAIQPVGEGVDPDQFIQANFELLTNGQMAQALGRCVQYVRNRCYAMGLLRMKLEYWTDDQIQFLNDNYQEMGDRELAEVFNSLWVKEKTWTIKHIEKKRMYLKLKRTPEQLAGIKLRNISLGYWAEGAKNTWLTRGAAQDGEIRMWYLQSARQTPFIKVNGKFLPWARYAWEQAYGSIPPGCNVVFKDNDPAHHAIDNLELVTNAELAIRNLHESKVRLSDGQVASYMAYNNPALKRALGRVPQLLDLKRQQILLARAIKNQSK